MRKLAHLCPVHVILAKKDLADPAMTQRWVDFLNCRRNGAAWAFDLRNANLASFRARLGERKPPHRELRLAVVGIPNVGKSFFLNCLVGRNNAPVGGIPGLTRGISWYKGCGFLAVDSPGILDPHAGDAVQRALSWLGCAKAEVIGGFDVIALDLIRVLKGNDLWRMIESRWGLPFADEPDADALTRVGVRLGCLVGGGAVNLELAGRRLVESFAAGKLGQVTLETPDRSLFAHPASFIADSLKKSDIN
jgi:ribosome biogenesis GTPase A